MRQPHKSRRLIANLFALAAVSSGLFLSAYLASGGEKVSSKKQTSSSVGHRLKSGKKTSEVKKTEDLQNVLNDISVKRSLESHGIPVDLPSQEKQELLAHQLLEFLRKTTTRVFGDEKIFSPDQVKAGMVVTGRFGGTFKVSQAMSDLLARSKQSVALIVNSSFFDDSTGTLKTKILHDYRNPLCSDDKFSFGNEPIVPFNESSVCTGALVGANLLLTAHHCIPDAQTLSNRRFLFDYGNDAQGKIRTSFLPSEVYLAKQGGALIGPTHYDGIPGADWVLVELAPKEPQARNFLPIIATDASVDEKLYMLGHPLGLSLKADVDGSVKMLDSNGSVLLAILDSFIGNSGSPVFDQASGKIVGVVSGGLGGGTDLVFENGCYSVLRCKTANCDPIRLTASKNFESAVSLFNNNRRN